MTVVVLSYAVVALLGWSLGFAYGVRRSGRAWAESQRWIRMRARDDRVAHDAVTGRR